MFCGGLSHLKRRFVALQACLLCFTACYTSETGGTFYGAAYAVYVTHGLSLSSVCGKSLTAANTTGADLTPPPTKAAVASEKQSCAKPVSRPSNV